MNTSISARELFDQLQQTLALRWLAGKSGKDVRTDRNEVTSKRPSLAGYLNVIHPNKVQPFLLVNHTLPWQSQSL